ncbi:PAS domain S-box protein [bacterium]|nr:PAS domain S-box protein [bacterium]
METVMDKPPHAETGARVEPAGAGENSVAGADAQASAAAERADAGIRESEETYRTIVENANEGIGIIDRDRLVFANQDLREMLGLDESEIGERNFFEFIHPDYRDEAYRVYQDHFSGRVSPPIFETVLLSATGVSTVVDVNARVIPYRGRPAELVLLHDISWRKDLEVELAAKAEELERSNADLAQFAYVASHDLQEPLRMVASYLQLLARRYKGKLDDTADDFINYAVDGAVRMQRLINDLLAYSRVGQRPLEAERVDLNDALARALTHLAPAIDEAGATVEYGDLPQVMGDPTQIMQLFQNLIGNSLKFRDDKPSVIRVGVREKGPRCVVEVRDNGIGISPDYFDRIFVIFQRLHPTTEYPGTGIGLAICKRIVERHGGMIGVESEPGQGATFYFSLPAAS